MRVPRIYTAASIEANGDIELEPGPSRHLSRVLRMKIGDSVVLFNGSGGQYPARITAIDRKSVRASVGDFEPVELESALCLQLGIAISRGERMDWVVQKATELGVSSIAPLLSERTEVRLDPDRAEKKLRHWQQIAISACEQCGRDRPPRLLPFTGLEQWLDKVDAQVRLVLHPRAGNSAPELSPPASVALLVGPEGGFSEEEIVKAEQAGFRSLQLGPRVLRTETAPLAAIAILQARWGDMATHDAS